MRWPRSPLLILFAATLCCAAPFALAQTQASMQTVCTITVNSPDEKEAFRRYLPAAKYQFVELVERGRPDWLGSACRAGVTCDVLIVSGHFDGSSVFFSDRLEANEHLPVDEMERVSCSESCTGLFSKLKEVHLFGCNTLNPQPLSSSSAEIVRSLVREGQSLKEAKQRLRSLNAGHGESSRDRMRQVFKDVPVIYGFSSSAPLGPTAASTLGAFLRSNGAREIGKGRPSRSLLGSFAPYGMAVTQGMTDQDPHAAVRRDVCQFADDRLSDVTRLEFIHQLLQRNTAETRIHLDRIQKSVKVFDDPARQTPDVIRARADIASDTAARTRFLDFARDADRSDVRARMLNVAQGLGWLTASQRRDELALMMGELHARPVVGVTEVDLACSLNQQNDLDGALQQRLLGERAVEDVAHAAVRACLGSAVGRARTLEGLISPNDADVLIARTYLRHRPITDMTELRQVAAGITRMRASAAQVRALEALGRHYVSDHEILGMLMRLYSETSSPSVQAAIAGILIRSDRQSIATAELLDILLKDRRRSTAGEDMVDALIHRLQAL